MGQGIVRVSPPLIAAVLFDNEVDVVDVLPKDADGHLCFVIAGPGLPEPDADGVIRKVRCTIRETRRTVTFDVLDDDWR